MDDSIITEYDEETGEWEPVDTEVDKVLEALETSSEKDDKD